MFDEKCLKDLASLCQKITFNKKRYILNVFFSWAIHYVMIAMGQLSLKGNCEQIEW